MSTAPQEPEFDDWAFKLTEDLRWGRHNDRARVWYRLGPCVLNEVVMGRVEITLGFWHWSVGFGAYARNDRHPTHNQKLIRGKAAQLRFALEEANRLMDPLVAAVQLGWQPNRAQFTSWLENLSP